MKLLHLYYDLMNLYGEYANITVLARHLKDQGLEVTVDRRTLGDCFDCAGYDFIYLGAGMESSQKIALRTFSPHWEELAAAIEKKERCFCSPAMPWSCWANPSPTAPARNIRPWAFLISPPGNRQRITGDVICQCS